MLSQYSLYVSYSAINACRSCYHTMQRNLHHRCQIIKIITEDIAVIQCPCLCSPNSSPSSPFLIKEFSHHFVQFSVSPSNIHSMVTTISYLFPFECRRARTNLPIGKHPKSEPPNFLLCKLVEQTSTVHVVDIVIT